MERLAHRHSKIVGYVTWDPQPFKPTERFAYGTAFPVADL